MVVPIVANPMPRGVSLTQTCDSPSSVLQHPVTGPLCILKSYTGPHRAHVYMGYMFICKLMSTILKTKIELEIYIYNFFNIHRDIFWIHIL